MTKKVRRLEPIDENLVKVKKTKKFIKKKKFSHSKNFNTPTNFKISRQIHQNQEKAIQILQKPWVAKFQTINNITQNPQKGSKKDKSDKKKMDENDPQLQQLRDKLLTMGLEKMEREDAEKLMRKECQKLYTSETSYSKIDFKSPISNNKKDVNGNKKESGNIFLDILGVSKPKPLFTLEDDPNDGNRNAKDSENEGPPVYDHLSEIKNEKVDESIIFEGEVQKSQKDSNFSIHEPRRQDIEVICLDDTDAKMNPLSSDDEIEILSGPSTSSKPPIQLKTFPKKSRGPRRKTPPKENFLKQATLPWHKPSNPINSQNLHEPDPDSGEEDDTMTPKIVRTITLFPTRRNQNEKVTPQLQRSLPDLNLYLDSISHFAAKMKNFHFRGMEKVNSNVQDLFSLGLKPTPLRIVSYNVLCQTTILRTNYLYQHLSSNPYFGGNRRACLEWKMRQHLLALELVNLKADVYCLQEVEYTHYLSFFDPLMRERGYKGFYTKKTGTNADGCAIFIRPEKLQHVFLEQIHFNFQTELMDKDNVAQILCVKFTGTDRHLLIGNTHILFNKNRGDIKLNQLAVFFAHINKAMGKIPKNSGLILCGDFNLEPFSKVYEFITEGQLEFGDCPRNELSGQGNSGGPVLRTFCVPSRCLVTNNCLFRKANEPHTECVILQHPLKLASVYEHTLPDGSKEISTYHKDDGCPDYIFYTVKKKISESENMKKIVESGIHLVQRLSLPSIAHYDMAFGKLPNEYAGSDHIPLLADFYIV